jgi:hypothetical protein
MQPPTFRRQALLTTNSSRLRFQIDATGKLFHGYREPLVSILAQSAQALERQIRVESTPHFRWVFPVEKLGRESSQLLAGRLKSERKPTVRT